MSEFRRELQERLQVADAALRQAQGTGDDYLVEIREAEIADLRRLATENGVALPDSGLRSLDLTAFEDPAVA